MGERLFAVRLMRRDVCLATQLGRDYDLPMALANLAEQEPVEAMIHAWGDDPTNKVRLLQDGRTDAQLRADFRAGATRLEIDD